MVVKGDDAEMLESIRILPRLCHSADELRAEAKLLGADARNGQALFMEELAKKPIVMGLNPARLGMAKVVAFSTHALTAGTLEGLKEPALVLTPPPKPDKQDNGLLELEDILKLKLTSNEWLILSACNTASADASGEALSGLARAFLYAGAQSLLVSQWSVEEKATEQLMTNIFSSYSRATLFHAQALQAAMRKLMTVDAQTKYAYFAHPFSWTSFFILGEGGLK